MSPTETVRAMLDERGIEWRSGLEGVTFVGDWCFVEYDGGKIAATCEPVLTPEQVIAATLGAEKRDTMELWPEWEEVLFANVSDEVAQDNLNECVHELLEKAATVGNTREPSDAVIERIERFCTDYAQCLADATLYDKRPFDEVDHRTCESMEAVEAKLIRELAEDIATVGEEYEMHICKRCGVAYELSIIDKGFGKPRFCPNCGARGVSE